MGVEDVAGLQCALGGDLRAFADRAEAHHRKHGRPFVSLCWAQTIDGCTALVRGRSAALSGPESLRLTHALRSAHACILVGIGTALADDPLLSVRHVPGPSPVPVVLDTGLRLPPGSRLLRDGRGPWVYAAETAEAARRTALIAAGARVRSVPTGESGHVDLEAVLDDLGRAGFASLMVEGGATVVTQFLGLGLADRVAITIAPMFGGAYHGVGALDRSDVDALPRLGGATCVPVGRDYLLCGDLRP